MNPSLGGGGAGPPETGDTLAEEGVALIRERCEVQPAVAVVLGSGLTGSIGDDVDGCHEFAFQALPGLPRPSAPGHPGRLLLGNLYGVPAALFLGRIHYYEGHGMAATTLIARLAAGLGARTIVLTNTAGALDPTLPPARLMVIEDHVNLLGTSVLAGWRWGDGTPAFADLSCVYAPRLRRAVEAAAMADGIELSAGVYAAVPGPAYETPAEARFLATAGAHAVGMSTVPEAVAAAALGLSVLGISCITNRAGEPTSHEEVLAAARRGGQDLRAILRRVVPDVTDEAP
ncbi:MAG TPA: purine-nucleoside phosphorylase [Actinomycetota bacterium]